MPAERRTFTATKPVKTERTHEENQERAYIAASRRSDRSLEARIESARRASEIHKKRTGRALRVTEQDVINEEMYEEEDDDLPTQYQRLNAHLHTTSVMFNKKLHDYIATQHGVRNMFMSQYQNPSYQQFGSQFQANGGSFPQANNWLNPSMLPPQQFNSSTPQGFQQAQSYSPTSAQPQGFRQAPYHIPQRPQPHQRSLSIQLPHAATTFDPSTQQTNASVTTPQGGVSRRMSLPPQASDQASKGVSEGQLRPTFSRSPTAQSPQTVSPTAGSFKETSRLQSNASTPTSYTYSPTSYTIGAQPNTNPLTLSLPPESQQLIGSALDPHDPRTAIFMSGSDNLPQPFAPTYTYNPNLSKTRTTSVSNGTGNSSGSTQTLSTGLSLKMEAGPDTNTSTIPTSISDGFYAHDAFLTPGNGDYNAFFDFQGGEFPQMNEDHGISDQLDGNNFVNWD
ncbi:Nn.00g052370.m01.CDS01 [Neocucurbitaria sp. VM-36]